MRLLSWNIRCGTRRKKDNDDNFLVRAVEEARSGQESPENVISKECLNVGDIITYIPIEYCQCFGNKQFIIQSTVLSVDPEAEENDKLKLVSG